MFKSTTFLLASLLLLFFVSCEQDDQLELSNTYSISEFEVLSQQLNLPASPFSYKVGNLVAENGNIDHIGTMGRVLFYDKQLSVDGSISCASCHKQELAFSDNISFSEGVNGNFTQRNSIALGAQRNFGAHYENSISTRSAPGLFWDERASTIKDQLKQTIHNPNEMGSDMSEIVSKLASSEQYQILNKNAYNTNEITEDHVLQALEAFINSISSSDTKVQSQYSENLNYITGDSIVGGQKDALGLQLFKSHCNGCHGPNLSTESELTLQRVEGSVANNGLPLSANDVGVFEQTQNQADKGKFKIPGLFNIALTAPYMHDGRFENLEAVVNFYSDDIQYSDNLHPFLKDGNKAKTLNLNTEEKKALVDFLDLFTDDNIREEEKWGNPFK